MDSALRKTGRFSAWAVVAVATLVAVVGAALQTPWAKDRIRREIVDRTNGAIEGNLEIRRLSGSLLWSATLEDVELDDARGRPVARIRRLHANYSLISLVWGHLEVDSVAVEQPRALLRRYADGTLNVATLVEPTDEPVAEPSEFQVSVEGYTMTEGRVAWHDGVSTESRYPGREVADQLDTLATEASVGDIGPAMQSLRNAQAPAVSSTSRPSAAFVSNLALSGSLEWNGARALEHRLDELSCRVQTDTLPRILSPTLRHWTFSYGSGRASTDLESFTIGDGLALRDLSGSASMTDSEEVGAQPEYLHARVRELELGATFGSLFVPDGRLTSDVTTGVEVGGTLDRLRARSTTDLADAGGVELGATLGLESSPVEYRVAARADGVHPAQVADIEGLELPDATIHAALHAEGAGLDPKTATLSTEFAIWESNAASVRIDRLYGKASLEEGRARLEAFSLDSSRIQARATGSVGLDGSFQFRAQTQTFEGGLSSGDFGLENAPNVSVERADTFLDLSGQLDLDSNTPTGVLRHIEGRSRWDVTSVRVLEHRVESSRGSAEFAVRPPEDGDVSSGDEPRELRLTVDAEGRGISLPAFAVGRFRVDGSARGRLAVGADAPSRAIERLDSSWSGRASGLRTGDLSVGSLSFESTVASPGGGLFRGSMQTDVAKVRAGGAAIGAVSGEWNGTVRLRDDGTPVERFSIEGTSRISEVAAGGATIRRVETDIDLAGGLLEPSGTIASTITGLEVAGRSFTASEVEVRAMDDRTLGLALRAAPDAAPDRPYRLDTTVGYNTGLEVFRLAKLDVGRSGQMWNLAGQAGVELLPEGVRIDGFELRDDAQRISVDGDFRTRGTQDLDVTVEALDLDGLQQLAGMRPIPGLAGQIGLEVSLRGTSAEPILSLTADGTELRVLEYGPGTFQTSLHSEDGWVQLEEFTADLADHSAGSASGRLPFDWNLTGAWSFDTRAVSRLSIDLKTTTFDQLARTAPGIDQLPIDGQFGGNFEFEGNVQSPSVDSSLFVRNVSIHGDIAGMRVDLDDIQGEMSFHFGTRSDADRRVDFRSELQWKSARLLSVSFATDAPLAEWTVARSRGRLPGSELLRRMAREPVEFSAELEETDLSEVPLEPLKEADVEGMLRGAFSIEGTLLEPDADATVDLENFGWNQYRDIYANMRAELADGVLELQKMRVEWDAEEVLAAQGSVPVPIAELVRGESFDDVPLDLVVTLKPISLMKLSAVDYSFNRFKGTLAGYVRLSGTMHSPVVDARASLRNAQFTDGKRGTVGAWVHADATGATGGALFCAADNPIATAQFDVPLHLEPFHLASGGKILREGPVRMSVQGSNIPIEQIVPTPLVEDWVTEPEGYIQADLQVEGTWDQLEPSGSLAVEEGGITLVAYGRRFKNIQMRSSFARDEIRLESFRLDDSAEGTVRASGSLSLERLRPSKFDAHIETESFDAGSFASNFVALVTTKTDVSGKLRADRQDIEVDVSSLTVELPQTQQSGTHPTTVSEDIVVVEKHEDDEINRIDDILAESSAAADLLEAHIDIAVSDKSYIRHPNGFQRFSADLEADLVGAELSLSGRVNAVRGDFQFLGKDFRVDQRDGIVRFTGATPPNPRLDVVAIHPLDRKVVAELDSASGDRPKVFVRVKGSAREPTLDLTSEPTMSESEIIYVLMTGRPPANAEVGQEEGVASQAAAAAGGLFSALLEQKIAKNVPVDVFRFESGDSGLRGSKVRVGKYITSDLFLSSAYEFGQGGEGSGWETRLEWHFAPRWMVEAVYGDQQTGVVNTFWDVY